MPRFRNFDREDPWGKQYYDQEQDEAPERDEPHLNFVQPIWKELRQPAEREPKPFEFKELSDGTRAAWDGRYEAYRASDAPQPPPAPTPRFVDFAFSRVDLSAGYTPEQEREAIIAAARAEYTAEVGKFGDYPLEELQRLSNHYVNRMGGADGLIYQGNLKVEQAVWQEPDPPPLEDSTSALMARLTADRSPEAAAHLHALSDEVIDLLYQTEPIDYRVYDLDVPDHQQPEPEEPELQVESVEVSADGRIGEIVLGYTSPTKDDSPWNPFGSFGPDLLEDNQEEDIDQFEDDLSDGDRPW